MYLPIEGHLQQHVSGVLWCVAHDGVGVLVLCKELGPAALPLDKLATQILARCAVRRGQLHHMHLVIQHGLADNRQVASITCDAVGGDEVRCGV